MSPKHTHPESDWFTVDREAFVGALKRVKAAAGGQARYHLDRVLLHASGEEVTLSCGWTAFTVAVTLPAEVHEERDAVAVHVAELFQFTKLMPGKSLTVRVRKSWQQVIFREAGSQLSLGYVEEIDMPAQAEPGGYRGIEVNPNALMDAIKAVVFCTSRKVVTLDGAHVENVEGGVRFVATDGARMAIAEVECAEVDIPTDQLLPTSQLTSALRTIDPDRECWILFSGNVFVIRSGDGFAAFETVPTNFPDYHAIMPSVSEVTATALKSELLPFLRRGGLVTRKQPSRFALTADTLTVHAEGDTGLCDESMQVESTGECWFGMMPRHLQQAVDNVPGEVVKLHVKNELSPVLITGEKPGRQFIVMPMRVH